MYIDICRTHIARRSEQILWTYNYIPCLLFYVMISDAYRTRKHFEKVKADLICYLILSTGSIYQNTRSQKFSGEYFRFYKVLIENVFLLKRYGSGKRIDLFVIFFFPSEYQFMDVYKTAS